MVNDFVIAFGGTGARCVEALTYLYASRAITRPANILLVDPDAQNGNVGVARNQLLRYHNVQRQIAAPSMNGSAPKPGPFFSVKLNEQPGLEGFVWGYPNPKQSFHTLVGFASQTQEHQKLLELLYDEGDFNLEFERGYVGHAHIGSLDLVRTLRRANDAAADEENRNERDALQTFFRSLRAAAHAEGANLFVIGSVFGGTGASGIPAIPAVVGQQLADVRSKVNIGCAQVGPYFSFPKSDRERAPDSVRHALATQAALYHYATAETGYDRIYLIGSPLRDETNAKHANGGGEQTNRAHYVELAAGLAVADFFAGTRTGGTTDVYACGTTSVTWDKLPYGRPLHLRRCLVGFATFAKLYAEYLAEDLEHERHRNAPWTFELHDQTQQVLGGNEKELSELKLFCQRFLQWISELQRTSAVHLFAPDGIENGGERGLASMTSGARAPEQARRRMFLPIPRVVTAAENPFAFIIDRINRSREIKQPTAAGWYLGAVTDSVEEFCAANYESWWRSNER